jgi:shikimate dehydrogenase
MKGFNNIMGLNITGNTILTGLLGSPVRHSISPLMHNEAFSLLGLDYAYLCFDINEETLPQAVAGLKTLGVRGFNLTMPNKNLMCSLCDELSMASQISGAVNTVVNENGVLKGYTTDGIGFMRAAIDAGYDLPGKKMTLLGAGGVASAVLVQAAIDGMSEISVFSIHDQFYERAEQIVAQLNEKTSCKVTLYDFEDDAILRREIGSSYILVNGTSVGMAPHEDGCIIKDASFFHPELIVSDVIYNPRETKLMAMASKQGLRTFNGLYMLLYQGAEAFRLWTGQDMPTEVIKEKYFQ